MNAPSTPPKPSSLPRPVEEAVATLARSLFDYELFIKRSNNSPVKAAVTEKEALSLRERQARELLSKACETQKFNFDTAISAAGAALTQLREDERTRY